MTGGVEQMGEMAKNDGNGACNVRMTGWNGVTSAGYSWNRDHQSD